MLAGKQHTAHFGSTQKRRYGNSLSGRWQWAAEDVTSERLS